MRAGCLLCLKTLAGCPQALGDSQAAAAPGTLTCFQGPETQLTQGEQQLVGYGQMPCTHTGSTEPHREGQFLATEDPDTRDGAVIVSAEEDDAGESVLPQLVQALEHAWWEEEEEWSLPRRTPERDQSQTSPIYCWESLAKPQEGREGALGSDL